ncbi:sensor histidine kinase, partial [Megasphaera massiliensis]|nr:sensor histidine kinase [Megasphaera massiliensis]
LVDRLFLFSKLDFGQVDFTLERVSLREYFADFTAENTALLAERGLSLRYEAPPEAARVRLARMQIQRVV